MRASCGNLRMRRGFGWVQFSWVCFFLLTGFAFLMRFVYLFLFKLLLFFFLLVGMLQSFPGFTCSGVTRKASFSLLKNSGTELVCYSFSALLHVFFFCFFWQILCLKWFERVWTWLLQYVFGFAYIRGFLVLF